MSKAAAETLSVVVEREIPFPPEKIWRALTQPHLIEEWLMKNDFRPAVDHCFTLRGDWGAVDCQVLTIEPVPSQEWLEFEGGVISSLFTQTESALTRRRRSRHEDE